MKVITNQTQTTRMAKHSSGLNLHGACAIREASLATLFVENCPDEMGMFQHIGNRKRSGLHLWARVLLVCRELSQVAGEQTVR